MLGTIANKNNSKFSTMQLTKMALMLALVSISSYIVIPLPGAATGLTAQTLVINLTALLLTPKETFFTMFSYWLLGFIGAPVFAGGVSGPGKMLGPLGGYYIGFVVATVLISLCKGKKYNRLRYTLVVTLIGMPVIYGIACGWMKFIGDMTWKAAFLGGVLPFIPLDFIKAVAAVILAKPMRRLFSE